MELEPLTGWLWCLRTPIVQAYAVHERAGFNLIATTTAGNDTAILEALAGIDRRAAEDLRIYEVLLTHGHDGPHRFSRRAGRAEPAPESSPPASTCRSLPASSRGRRRGSRSGSCRCLIRSCRTSRPAGHAGPPGRRRRQAGLGARRTANCGPGAHAREHRSVV